MPGNPLNITLPTVGVTVGPQYATDVNTALQTLITDIEAKVTPDEIDVNADLTFASGSNNYSATNLYSLSLINQSALLGGSNPRRIFAFNGELYYQDASGNNVQITSGGGVNNASAGSINTTGVPAYGSSGVEVLWSGPSLEYRFKSGSGTDDLALIEVGSIEIGNNAFRTTLASSVAANYTLTFPAGAAAANDSVFTVSTAGAITFVRDLSIDTVTTTGDVTAGGLVEGTRLYYTANEEKLLSAFAMFNPVLANWSGTPTGASQGSSIWSASSGFSAGELIIDLGGIFSPNTDIGTIELYYGSSTAAGTWTMEIISLNQSIGTYTVEDSDSWTAIVGSVATTPAQRTWAASVSMLNDRAYFLRINVPNVANTREVHSVIIDHTRPQP